jgi:hypothetical protein
MCSLSAFVLRKYVIEGQEPHELISLAWKSSMLVWFEAEVLLQYHSNLLKSQIDACVHLARALRFPFMRGNDDLDEKNNVGTYAVSGPCPS